MNEDKEKPINLYKKSNSIQVNFDPRGSSARAPTHSLHCQQPTSPGCLLVKEI